MAWEQRYRQRYYTRSQRVAGRVRRTYVGRGVEGKLAEALDFQKRAQRQAQADAERVMAAKVEALCQLTRELACYVATLTEATFYAVGFHRHDRGQWRRRRLQGLQELTDEPPSGQNDLFELLALAKANDQTAIVRLREVVDAKAEVWAQANEMAERVRQALIIEACGTDLVAAELMRADMHRVKIALAGESVLPIIHLLADACAVGRAQVHQVDVMLRAAAMKPVHNAGVQKKFRMIHNRYLKVLNTLTTAERLLVAGEKTSGLAQMVTIPTSNVAMSMAG